MNRLGLLHAWVAPAPDRTWGVVFCYANGRRVSYPVGELDAARAELRRVRAAPLGPDMPASKPS